MLTMSVDKGALRTAHRIFSTADELLREALQNAYRAGADTVYVTLEAGEGKYTWSERPLQRLHIDDNGSGMAKPDDFFTLGKNGWDPAKTGVDPVEPAGWGAFSYPMEGVHEIVVRSGGPHGSWTAYYGPQHLDGVTPIELVLASMPFEGTSIEIFFKEDAVKVPSVERFAQVFTNIRWTYPMDVFLNGMKIESPVNLDYWRTARSPYGTLRWRNKLTDVSPAIEWEYSKVGVYGLTYAMEDLARDDQRYRAAMRYLDTLSWYFIADPASELRPDLPARRTLVTNDALRGLAKWLLDTLWDMLWEKVKTAVDALPDTVAKEPIYGIDFIQGSVPKVLRDLDKHGQLVDNVMRFAGYTRYEILPPATAFNAGIDWTASEKWHHDENPRSLVYYSKEEHLRASDALATTIMALKVAGNGADLPLVYGAHNGDEKIAFGEYTEHSEHLAFTDDIVITLDGKQYHLPWLIWDSDWYSWHFTAYDEFDYRNMCRVFGDGDPFLVMMTTPSMFNTVNKNAQPWLYPMCVHLADRDTLDIKAPYAVASDMEGGEVTSMYLSEPNMLNMLLVEALALVGEFSADDIYHMNEVTACVEAIETFASGYLAQFCDHSAELSDSLRFESTKAAAIALDAAWKATQKALADFERSL